MSYEIVHTIGSTVYFVFALLFFWASRVPRTNSGSLWWAFAMLFALAARLCFITLPLAQQDVSLIVSFYSAFNVVEKFLLIAGLTRFFGFHRRLIWWGIALTGIELWILLAWTMEVPAILRSLGIALFNGSALGYAAWLLFTGRVDVDRKLILFASIVTAVLAVHWLSAFAIVALVPAWLVHGFLFGTILVLMQYMALLAAVILSFERRLLAAEAKALDLALLDPLTGLNNQRYVDTLFEKALLLATRPHQILAVFYIDLDNFKPINDQAGHTVGDEVLKIVATKLREVTRSTDICARVGGDEFVAICTQLETRQQVDAIGRKLLSAFTSPIHAAGHEFVLGASIGASIYPEHGEALPILLQRSDAAMYQVKHGGKSGFQVFDPLQSR